MQVALLLLPQQGVPEDMIVGDFYARHTTTNLRNVSISRRQSTTSSRPPQYLHSHLLTTLQVGRFMLAYNLTRGIITTNYMQVSDGLQRLICWQTNRIRVLFANDMCRRFVHHHHGHDHGCIIFTFISSLFHSSLSPPPSLSGTLPRLSRSIRSVNSFRDHIALNHRAAKFSERFSPIVPFPFSHKHFRFFLPLPSGAGILCWNADATC